MFDGSKTSSKENAIDPKRGNHNHRQNRTPLKQYKDAKALFKMSSFAATQKKTQPGNNSEDFQQLFHRRIEQNLLNRNEFDLHGFTEKQAIEWVDCNINVILETLREYPAFLIITGRSNNSVGEPVLISAVEEHLLNHFAALHNLSVTRVHKEGALELRRDYSVHSRNHNSTVVEIDGGVYEEPTQRKFNSILFLTLLLCGSIAIVILVIILLRILFVK